MAFTYNDEGFLMMHLWFNNGFFFHFSKRNKYHTLAFSIIYWHSFMIDECDNTATCSGISPFSVILKATAHITALDQCLWCPETARFRFSCMWQTGYVAFCGELRWAEHTLSVTVSTNIRKLMTLLYKYTRYIWILEFSACLQLLRAIFSPIFSPQKWHSTFDWRATIVASQITWQYQ